MNAIKELNLNDVSAKQLEEMRHALGLPRKSRPYRNYFNCNANDSDWNDLVEKGFATKGGAWSEDTANYYLTFDAVKLVYRKRMSKKFYDDL